ncbi:MAG: hypothetical protein ACQEQK_07600, partial [Thermodesulfobacteriota bacterium]
PNGARASNENFGIYMSHYSFNSDALEKLELATKIFFTVCAADPWKARQAPSAVFFNAIKSGCVYKFEA